MEPQVMGPILMSAVEPVVVRPRWHTEILLAGVELLCSLHDADVGSLEQMRVHAMALELVGPEPWVVLPMSEVGPLLVELK